MQNNVTIDISSGQKTEQLAGNITAEMDTPGDNIVTKQSGETAKLATTQFADDAMVVSRDESKVAHIDDTILHLANPQETVDNLLDFLKKPIILAQGSFSTTDTFSIFNSYSMPYAALQSSQGAIWRNKLLGFFGIRMDMRFRLVVNANKFQQGRYIMGWTPLGGASPNTSNLKNLKFNQAHNATLVQRTTVPHVELDLSTNTVAELLVPFASVHNFYSLNAILASSDYGGLGYINVYPYSTMLAPTGSTVCGYTLYVSFENVSLYGAASAQAGSKGVSQNEIANKNNGPVSGVTGAIAKGFAEFENIPLIGQYAKGISWVSDRISKTASIFGFSKPTAGDCIPKMQITNAPSHSTVDGDSDVKALSYLNRPGVVPIKGHSGTEYDEMDFSYLKMKYAWIRTLNWNLSGAPDDVIDEFLVGPSLGAIQLTVGGIATTNFVPVSFVSSQFRYWRGSLRFRFKFVKTEYHSGRIQFAYYPGDQNVYTGQESYVNRLIVDIRDHKEVELIIPYISKYPWMHGGSTGNLVVTVVDPLVAPASVSSSINILTEFSGGPDFEVAGPGNVDYTPTIFTPQGLMVTENDETLISTTLGNMEIHGDPVLMTSSTIGDKVSSARALLKRFGPIDPALEGVGNYDFHSIGIIPDAVHFYSGPSVIEGATFNADYVSLWASCYMFMSGGIRIRDILDYGLVEGGLGGSLHASVVSTFMDSAAVISQSAYGLAATQQFPRQFHRVFQDCSSNNTLTVEVPQYTTTLSRNMNDLIIFQNATMGNSSNYIPANSSTPYRPVFMAPQSLSIVARSGYSFHRIYRAGSDDFQLSLFISVPPMMVLPNVLYTTNY